MPRRVSQDNSQLGYSDATSAVLALLRERLGDIDPEATRALWAHDIFVVVDLSGDDRPERIACPGSYVNLSGQKVSLRGATGNGAAWVLTERGGRWFDVGDVSGKDVRVLERRTRGWLDLWTYTDAGAQNKNYIHRFRGGRYVPTDEMIAPGVAEEAP